MLRHNRALLHVSPNNRFKPVLAAGFFSFCNVYRRSVCLIFSENASLQGDAGFAGPYRLATLPLAGS